MSYCCENFAAGADFLIAIPVVFLWCKWTTVFW